MTSRTLLRRKMCLFQITSRPSLPKVHSLYQKPFSKFIIFWYWTILPSSSAKRKVRGMRFFFFFKPPYFRSTVYARFFPSTVVLLVNQVLRISRLVMSTLVFSSFFLFFLKSFSQHLLKEKQLVRKRRREQHSKGDYPCQIGLGIHPTRDFLAVYGTTATMVEKMRINVRQFGQRTKITKRPTCSRDRSPVFGLGLDMVLPPSSYWCSLGWEFVSFAEDKVA